MTVSLSGSQFELVKTEMNNPKFKALITFSICDWKDELGKWIHIAPRIEILT
jgi:hypothetical protein